MEESLGVSLKLLKNIITIDGPGGVGKGTLAFSLAKKLGWEVLDSGLIYRLIGFIAAKKNLSSSKEIIEILEKSSIKLITNIDSCSCEINFNNKILGEELRNEKVAVKASEISKDANIRSAIIKIQRNAYLEDRGLIADGRDMGTVIFPEAALKIFLEASPEIRAERRANQLKEKGMNVIMHDLLLAIKERDKKDMNRNVSPLRPAKEAIIVDTSKMSIIEVEEKVMEIYKKL